MTRRWRIPARDTGLGRMLRFGAVGGVGVGVNIGALWLLHGVAGLHLAWANALAVECAVLHNFALNDRWTFADRHTAPWTSRIIRFHGVSLVGMLANQGVVLAAVAGGMHYLLAGMAGIAAGFTLNFVLNIAWTYGDDAPDAPLPQADPAEDD